MDRMPAQLGRLLAAPLAITFKFTSMNGRHSLRNRIIPPSPGWAGPHGKPSLRNPVLPQVLIVGGPGSLALGNVRFLLSCWFAA